MQSFHTTQKIAMVLGSVVFLTVAALAFFPVEALDIFATILK